MFSDTLKRLRKQSGWTQQELADKVQMAKSAISMLENGLRIPSFETLEAFADVFNVDMNTMTGQNSKSDVSLKDIIPYVRGRRIPILGAIRAGAPLLAEEHIEGYDYADVPELEGYFFLRVKGDSMINAHIFDGDIVLIKQQDVAENRDVVVCLVNGDEATLKRFHQQGDMVVLQPENPAYQPILVPCKDFASGYARIIGVAKEVRHNL